MDNKLMCCFTSDYIFFWIVLILVLAGSIPGGRNLIYRQVNCEKYLDCPDDISSQLTMTSQCVQYTDPMGLSATGNMELSSPRPSLPTFCWTNGLETNTENPLDVVIWYYIGVAAFVVIWLIVRGICLYGSYKYNKRDNYKFLIDEFEYREYNNKLNYSCPVDAFIVTSALLITITFCIYLISTFVVAVYTTQYRQVNCINYKQCTYTVDSWTNKQALTSYVKCVELKF